MNERGAKKCVSKRIGKVINHLSLLARAAHHQPADKVVLTRNFSKQTRRNERVSCSDRGVDRGNWISYSGYHQPPLAVVVVVSFDTGTYQK